MAVKRIADLCTPDDYDYTVSGAYFNGSDLLGKRIRICGYLLSYTWVTTDLKRQRLLSGETFDEFCKTRLDAVRTDSIAYLVPYTDSDQFLEVEQNRERYYCPHPFVYDSWLQRLFWKGRGWRTPGPLYGLLRDRFCFREFTPEAILLDSADRDVFEVLGEAGVGGWLGSAYGYKNLAVFEGILSDSRLHPFRLRLTDLTAAVVYNDWTGASPDIPKSYSVPFR